jgi:hypothetical protein
VLVRSAHYALANGIELSEEEFAAITFSDKTDDKMAEYHNSMLGDLLKWQLYLLLNMKKQINNGFTIKK